MNSQQAGGVAIKCTKIVFFVPLLIALLSGCVFREQYPEEWEGLQEVSDECPNIAGTYKNIGQLDPSTVEKGQYTAYWEIPLTGELLDSGRGEEAISATHVEIAQPTPGILEVKAWEESELVTTKRYYEESGDFKCKSGFLVIHFATNCGGAPEAFGCGSRNDHFAKGTDGALILKLNEKGVGAVMIIIPAAVSDWRWYRFDAIAP